MNPFDLWTRRSLLKIGFLLSFPAQDSLPDQDELLMGHIRALNLPIEIGKAYLEETAFGLSEADLSRLLVILKQTVRISDRDLRKEPALLFQRLRDSIRADYSRSQTICYLQGWYLSLTECRLAAIKYLSQKTQEEGN